MRKSHPAMERGHAVKRPQVPLHRGSKKNPKRRPEANSRLLKIEIRALQKICEHNQTPRTLMIKLLVDHGEWDQLVSLDCKSEHYLEHQEDRFRTDYLASSLLSKSPTLPTSFDRRDEAISDFWAAEAVCAETNARLDSYAEGGCLPLDLDVHKAIHFAVEYIKSILGNRPSRANLEYAESRMRFGPGSTTSVSGNVTSGVKYSPRRLDVTPRLSEFGIRCLPRLWQNGLNGLREVRCSKFTTVPKNAKKDRGICIEPDLNIFVQLGTGALLRSLLRSSGLDLDHGADWNRWLASKALDWRLTTLDLSAASDTVSRSVVWLLLPEKWAQLLLLSRVDKTRMGDRNVTLNKWSSMGNGYTFELESLIFWGILNGCLKVAGLGNQQSACFGDDLIFPSELTTLVTRTLTFLGFKVNEKKTFSTGLFRESCGTDFFNGTSVRPVFFKGLKDDDDEEIDEVQACFTYANNLRRWAHHSGTNRYGEPACDSRILPAFLSVLTSIPDHKRHRIPEGCGDNGVIGNWDECQGGAAKVTPFTGSGSVGWGGYHYREYFRPVVKDFTHMVGSYLATLAGQALEASGGQAMRGRFKTATTRWAYALAWPNLGPWR